MRYFPANRVLAALYLALLLAAVYGLGKLAPMFDWHLGPPKGTHLPWIYFVVCCQVFWFVCSWINNMLECPGSCGDTVGILLGTAGLLVTLLRGLVYGYWDQATPTRQNQQTRKDTG